MTGKAMLLLLLLQWCADFSWADELCNDGIHCNDTGYEIGYCCGIWKYSCCHYIPLYSMWYIWFAIGVGILVLAVIVVFCCGKSHSSRRAANTSRSVDVATVNNAVATDSVNASNDFRMDDAPPSYEMVQHQQWMLQQSEDKPPPYQAPEPQQYSETSLQNQPAGFNNATT